MESEQRIDRPDHGQDDTFEAGAMDQMGSAAAGRVLSDLREDQRATRLAAAPPRWLMAAVAICLGATLMVDAIPMDSVKIPLMVAVCLADLVLLTQLRRRPVRAGRWGAMAPWRGGSLLAIVWIVATLVVFVVLHDSDLAWWMRCGAGVIIAASLYLVLRLVWWDWARTVRPADPAPRP